MEKIISTLIKNSNNLILILVYMTNSSFKTIFILILVFDEIKLSNIRKITLT